MSHALFAGKKTIHWNDHPSFDQYICYYKEQALLEKQRTEKPLTECQHSVAKRYGYKDWQSFNYYLKTLHNKLEKIELESNEWGYLCDSFNGHAVLLNMHQGTLHQSVVDNDIYNNLGHKWFNEFSEINEDKGYYKASPAMKKFIEKIKALTEQQETAVIQKALCFWRHGFYPS